MKNTFSIHLEFFDCHEISDSEYRKIENIFFEELIPNSEFAIDALAIEHIIINTANSADLCNEVSILQSLANEALQKYIDMTFLSQPTNGYLVGIGIAQESLTSLELQEIIDFSSEKIK